MRVFLLTLLLTLPMVVFAADTSFFGPIVPKCAYAPGAEPCQACDLVAAADNILKFFVTLVVAAAAVMFAYAGMLYVTAAASQGNIESAKKLFFQVFLGLIFVLAAYLIIDLTLKVLTNQSFKALTRIECLKITHPGSGATQVKFTPVPGAQESVGSPLTATQGGLPEGTYTHEQAVAELAACGITNIKSSGTCSDQNNKTCTSLQGMPKSVVTRLCSVKSACPTCSVVITGGTEIGHTYHGTGIPSVDIGFNESTAAWLFANKEALGIRQICTRSNAAAANEYKYRYNCAKNEKQQHLHITFGGG